MENEAGNQATNVIEVFGEQLNFLLEMLARPVVQRQILVVLLILLASWLLSEGIRRLRLRRGLTGASSDGPDRDREGRWKGVLAELMAPVAALTLLYLAIWAMSRLDYPNGLLQDLTELIWLWLLYRGVQALLYAQFGEAARPYQRRIVMPIFLLLIAMRVLRTLPGATSIANIVISIGAFHITVSRLATALIVFYLFAVVAWAAKETMERTLPGRLNVEPGVVQSFSTIMRYSLVAIGIVVSLGIMGVSLTSLAIVAGGLSVGIGIGLQDIVANFISGVVLLFEQSLRPGDVIELGNRVSQVSKISLRATTVLGPGNVEVIIPNNTFTTTEVKNLTKSDRMARVTVPFGIGYDSDPEAVREMAVNMALEHPLVLSVPAPLLVFGGFGESSLNFELWVFVNQPELTTLIRSDLFYALWKVFKANDIDIPFPQRDLNLGRGWERVVAHNPGLGGEPGAPASTPPAGHQA